MIKWVPKLPNQLDLDQDKASNLYQKRILSFVGTLFLGGFLLFLFPSNSLPAIITFFIMVALSVFFYIRWRNFFLSYWYRYNSNSIYYKDYTWKDSLIMALILILGTGLSGFVLFYIAFRVDFTNLQPIAWRLNHLFQFFRF